MSALVVELPSELGGLALVPSAVRWGAAGLLRLVVATLIVGSPLLFLRAAVLAGDRLRRPDGGLQGASAGTGRWGDVC
eukprot:12080189-Alexandrium_andersonii.AAC.1